MSTCLECGKKMHAAEAAKWYECVTCRKKLGGYDCVPSIHKVGVDRMDRKVRPNASVDIGNDGDDE